MHLRKGWNKLLVKLAQEKADWQLRLRFTTPTGKPLELDTTAEPAAVGKILETYKKDEPRTGLPAPAVGAAALFRKKTEMEPKNAQGWFYYGSVLQHLSWVRKLHKPSCGGKTKRLRRLIDDGQGY